MAQARLHQGEGDTGIHRFTPAKAEAFHQHPRHLGDIGVGIGIRRAAAHNNQQGVAQGHIATGLIDGFADACPRRLDHLQINAQFAAVVDLQAGFSAVGVQDRWNVVLGMASGKQHAGHGQHPLNALLPEFFEAIAKDGPGKFQIAMLHR